LGNRTLLVSVAIFAATFIVSLIFSRSLTHPLAVLTQTAEDVAAGNLDTEIQLPEQKDEIGGLAKSFTTMQKSIKGLVGDLEEVNHNLENLVEERTKDLEVSELRSRSIIQSAGEGIIVIDKDSNIILWNQTAENMFGYTAEDVIDQSLSFLIPERYLSQHEPSMQQAIDAKALAHPGVTHEFAAVRKDGTEIPIELTLSMWSVAGETFVSGILRDISERKKAEEEIRQSNERIQRIIEIAPDAVITIDEEQRITLFNPKAEDVFGYTAEEVMGKPLTMLMPDKSRDLHSGEVGKFKQEEVPARSMDDRREIFGKRKDGSMFPAEAGIAKTKIDGEYYFTTFFRDITVRKRMSEQLELANERMSEELNFARDIQMGLLPLIFPAFPTREEFNIFAALIPAREVGGDFYDFYFLDEEHLCFVVGDVSGKGAPGALLMAVSKTLIKSRAMDDFQPSSILSHVNSELSQNNESAMFVTVFLSIINIRTGKVEYTNAGHNPPFIKRINGSVEKLDEFHGPVIGALPNLNYKESSTVLEKGDIIVVYSDGITEAMNIDDELYSDERLEEFLSLDKLSTPQKLVDLVIRDVKRHEGEAEQADDITILALEFSGQINMVETGRLDIKIKNQLSELEDVEEQFEQFCHTYEIPDTARQQVSMVLDEMLNNVVNYAYRDDKEHIIEVEFILSGTRLVINLRDDGVPFNPFALDPPNIALSLDDREVGGLGIFLVRNVMDEYLYSRHIGRNVVNLVKLIEK
jgi:sigma-B regulation protein RsbU (phosphoserine phosphatase)